MNRGEQRKTRMRLAAALILVAGLLAAAPVQAGPKEKRFLVRYAHGSANLATYTGLKLYIGEDRVRVYAGNDLIHDIPIRAITGINKELRSPFDPAKTTERVFNDTVGACSNIIDCPVLGAAGVVGATGVGVATLFTPKQNLVHLNWEENGQPMELAMYVAWYQRDFILRALEKASGRKTTEYVASGRGGPQKPAQTSAPPAQVTTLRAAAAQTESPTAAGLIRRFELVLDRPALVGGTQLEEGFYLVLVQERAEGKALLVILDDSVRDGQETKIVARATAEVAAGDDVPSVLPVFVDAPEGTVLSEFRLPGKTLKLTP